MKNYAVFLILILLLIGAIGYLDYNNRCCSTQPQIVVAAPVEIAKTNVENVVPVNQGQLDATQPTETINFPATAVYDPQIYNVPQGSRPQPIMLRSFPTEIQHPQTPFYNENTGQQFVPQNTMTGAKSISAQTFINAGYSQTMAQRLEFASPVYLESERQTGIRWEVWATIHIMEISAQSINPANGQGPLQMTGPWQIKYNMSFPPGPLSQQGLLEYFILCASAVQKHFEYAVPYMNGTAESEKNINSTLEKVQGEFAYTYNGRAYGPNYMDSGYVAVGHNGVTSRRICEVDGCATTTIMTRDGYLANFYKLVKLNIRP